MLFPPFPSNKAEYLITKTLQGALKAVDRKAYYEEEVDLDSIGM